jgi:urease accessory protein
MFLRPAAVAFALLVLLAGLVEPALAHHVMGGKMPATFLQGFLSGIGHPVIGIDHLAAIVAVGCLAALHPAGALLAVSFVVAMMGGVALHLQGATVPAAELVVALTVLLVGGLLLRKSTLPLPAALILFVFVGAIHGYALGESIYGAEQTPLFAYLFGLAVIQSAIALGAMAGARVLLGRKDRLALRFIGAAVAGVGLAVLVQQLVPAV